MDQKVSYTYLACCLSGMLPRQQRASVDNMKKQPADKGGDDLRRQYDLSDLSGGIRGKYYRRATAGNNLVLIEPDLAVLFPDSETVNRALRVLAEAAQTATKSKRRPAR